jgi:ATP-dependent protease ClpP protease subunit
MKNKMHYKVIKNVALMAAFSIGFAHANTNEIKINIVKDIKINNLIIQQVQNKPTNGSTCSAGYSDSFVIKGEIGPDSSYVLEKLLSEARRCTFKYKNQVYTERILVALDSNGGLLVDGIKLGKIFRSQGVLTHIKSGDMCASSCAVAFIGGNERAISGDGKLLFHSPYKNAGYGIACISKSHAEEMKHYFIAMLDGEKNTSVGQTLFERTMSYCGSAEGWIINRDAGLVYGIINQK